MADVPSGLARFDPVVREAVVVPVPKSVEMACWIVLPVVQRPRPSCPHEPFGRSAPELHSRFQHALLGVLDPLTAPHDFVRVQAVGVLRMP